VTNYVLAARVAATREEAAALLDWAGTLDSACAWVPYGKGWLAARDSEWPAARDEIARAKAADPGHVWTYWLEAWMTTRTGAIAEAAADLEAFLDRARDDPRIHPHILSESQLDLAMLWTLEGEAKDARALIGTIDPNSVGAARRLLALASVDQALEDLAPALAAAEQAEKVAPGQVMPVLQQALLYDDWLNEPEKAGAAWKRVLDMARSSSELSAVLERTRAGVRLERFHLAHPQSATDAASGTGSGPERR
jgi:tetratricopeptide (TPR) repeat protein